MTTRCALVGTGHWTASALLPALRAQTGADVVACVGGTLEEGHNFARKHAIPNAYSTLDKMLARENLDIAMVATPDHLHAEAVETMIRAGVAVYCEMPLSNDAPSAHKLVALQKVHGIPATVGYSFRFNPAVQALKADLSDGKFGDIWLIELAEHNRHGHLVGWPNKPGFFKF